MNTRSGEILSALIAIGVATGTVLVNESAVLNHLREGAPAWLGLAYFYCAVALFSAVSGKLWSMGRFMSGVCWGSLLLLLIQYGKPYPLAFIALILFCFDVFIVVRKGIEWTSHH